MAQILRRLGAAALWFCLATPVFSQPQRGGAASAPPPAADPDLTQPLTPLGRFNVRPTPQAKSAPAPRSVTYQLTVRGLGGVGLEAAFRNLSALAAGHGKAASELQIRVRAEDDQELARRLLHTLGYYEAQVSVSTRAAQGPARFAVLVAAKPGRQFRFASVAVTGPPTAPPGLARQALDLAAGDPIIADAVRAAEANVSLALPEHGYPFVEVGERDIALDAADATGDYALPVSPGPRSRFGRIQPHESVFDRGHLRVIARFRPGQLYDSRKVDDFRRALVATQLFSAVGVEPVRTGRRFGDGTEVADLRVTGGAAKPRVLSASIGYETGLGAKLVAQWTDLNLVPPEGALTVRGIAGTQQQLLGLEFRRSNAGRRDRTLDAKIQAGRNVTAAYAAYSGVLQVSVARESTPLWQKRWTYSAAAETEVSSEQAYSLALGRKAWGAYKIVGLRLGGGYDHSNSLLDPTRGYTILATLAPEAELGPGVHPFAEATLEGRVYVPVAAALVLAGRLRFGALLGIDPQQLAPSRRLYEGGGDSIRGYSYQEVGPKAPDGSPLGGGSSTNVSVEARYRFGNFGVVGFVDGGQLYEGSRPRFSHLRYGVGLGARYYTSFGPVRLDIATPIARRPGEGVIGVYVSIGQAF